jgi:hypothetical protein
MSTVAGIDNITITQNGVTKQLGIWYAPNWSIVYLALFPLFLVCMSRQTSFVREFLKSSASDNTIVMRNGSQISETQILHILDSEFRQNNGMFILLVALTTVITLTGWAVSCAMPLVRWDLTGQAVGWANAQIAKGSNKTEEYPCLIYTAVAYVWMGIALYVYLAYLFTGFVYSSFFRRLSQGDITVEGITLQMIRTANLPRQMAEFLFNVLFLCFLGIIAAFLIRLDVAFLYSDDESILHFWFGDFSAVLSFGDFHSILSHVGITIPKGKFQMSGAKDMDLNTSLASIVATVVTFIACALLVLDALKRARQFTITKLEEDPSFRHKIKLTIADVKSIKNQEKSELDQMIPELKVIGIASIGVILCSVFTSLGILFSSMIILVLFRYIYRMIGRLK